MRSEKKIALAGAMTALSVVFLFVGSIFQMLDLSAAALGSLVALAAMIELGKGYAVGVWLATSLLSLLLLPYKTPAVIYALFAGFYPVLKEWLNRIKPVFLSYIVRLIVFNAFFTAVLIIAIKIFGDVEGILAFKAVVYAAGNITFLVFDFALERIALFYATRIKGRIIK